MAKRIFGATVFICMSIYALNGLAWGWGNYKSYQCSSRDSANACSSSCKKDTFEIEFKLNQQKDLVMLLYYENNKSAGASTYEGCKIIDNQNWSCESKTLTRKTFISMKNGLFERIVYDLSGLGGPLNSDEFSCAKR